MTDVSFGLTVPGNLSGLSHLLGRIFSSDEPPRRLSSSSPRFVPQARSSGRLLRRRLPRGTSLRDRRAFEQSVARHCWLAFGKTVRRRPSRGSGASETYVLARSERQHDFLEPASARQAIRTEDRRYGCVFSERA